MKKLLALLLIITLTLTALCSCDEEDKEKDPENNNGKTTSSAESADDKKLSEVDPKTGKINIDEPIVPVELHTNSYLYTVLKYNEDGKIIGATDYNTNPRFSHETVITYEYVENADGTMTLYIYSDISGDIYEYDKNGYCTKFTHYIVNSENPKSKEEIFLEKNKTVYATYQYDDIGRVTSRTSYTQKDEVNFTIAYTYNDDNVVLTKITTLPSGETHETLEFSLDDNGDYSQLRRMNISWKEDSVAPFEWTYKVYDDVLERKTMKDEHGTLLEFIYSYDDNGSINSIRYCQSQRIVPVQYFLGEGALMENAESSEIIVFMPLSKVLAKQNQE